MLPTPTLSLDCSGYFPNVTPGARFGSRVSTSSECFYVAGVLTGGVEVERFSFGSSGTGVELQRYADPKPLRRFVLDAASKSASLEYADGTSGALSFSQQAFAGSYSIFLLAYNNGGTASYSISGTRLSACRIFDGSTLIRDFIPVRVGRFGYLFDRVTGKFFANQGTGDFLLGPDIGMIPGRLHPMGVSSWGVGYKPYDAEVGWIEPTGTQYIDIPTTGTPNVFYGISGTAQVTAGIIRNNVFFDASTDSQFLSTSYSEQTGGWLFGSNVGGDPVGGGFFVGDTMRAFYISTSGRMIADGTISTINRPIATEFTALRLFAIRGSSTASRQNMSNLKLGSLKITVGSTVEHDFTPVRVGSGANAVGYLYDKANPTGGPLGNGLYPNSGSGEFVVGPDIS